MIATIIQGCILLTALQDPHQQEKTYVCHLSFKMTEMAEGIKQLSRALWYTTSMSEGNAPVTVFGSLTGFLPISLVSVPQSVTAKLMGNPGIL